MFRTQGAQRQQTKWPTTPRAGLPVRQLLKMVASGDLSPAEFKQLTKHVVGCDEEVPIDVTGDDTAECEAPAQPTAAAPSQLPRPRPRQLRRKLITRVQRLTSRTTTSRTTTSRTTLAPNSIPPERVFSVLNDTFDDDQCNSMADYIELCLQLQFNSRTR